MLACNTSRSYIVQLPPSFCPHFPQLSDDMAKSLTNIKAAVEAKESAEC